MQMQSVSSVNRIVYQNLQDTLKAFDDFETKQKSV